MDRIVDHGSWASNFCDLGGSLHRNELTEALMLLEKDATVKVILINMFLGSVSTVKIANSIIDSFVF